MLTVSLKHGKQKLAGVSVDPSQPPSEFFATVQELTGVPQKRMKVLVKGSVLKGDSWGKVSLKEGMTVMVMGTAEAAGGGEGGGAAAAGGNRGGGGMADARELLEAAAAAPAAAAASAKAGAPQVASGGEGDPPLCRVAIKHGAASFSLRLGNAAGSSDSTSEFAALTVASVMQELSAVSGIPPNQQKLVSKGSVLAPETRLADCGFKAGKDGVLASRMVLMGTEKYHKATDERHLLATTQAELDTMESDCASLVKAASHRANPAEVQVRVSRLMGEAGGMRSRLSAVSWRGDGMEDEAARQALLERLSAVDRDLEAVRKQI